MSFEYGLLVLGFSLVTIAVSVFLCVYPRRQNRGTQKMTEFSDAPWQGARG
ncbi:MAG: hypothetical protein ABR867_01545 [Nitrososphaerales archaeon]